MSSSWTAFEDLHQLMHDHEKILLFQETPGQEELEAHMAAQYTVYSGPSVSSFQK